MRQIPYYLDKSECLNVVISNPLVLLVTSRRVRWMHWWRCQGSVPPSKVTTTTLYCLVSLHIVFRKLHKTQTAFKCSILSKTPACLQTSTNIFKLLPQYFQHPSSSSKGAQSQSRHSKTLLRPFQTLLNLFHIFLGPSMPFQRAYRSSYVLPDKLTSIPETYSLSSLFKRFRTTSSSSYQEILSGHL